MGFKMANNLMDERSINQSPEAPIDGVYRYELIPANKPMEYYIDIWYQFGLGDDKDILNRFDDAVYLKAGDRVEINVEGEVSIKKKKRHLSLVVNNETTS